MPNLLDNSIRLAEMLQRCEGAYASKTLSGYHNDLQQFSRWCAENQTEFLPATPETVAAFVDAQACRLCIATIKRRVEAIKFAHRMCDLASPAGHSEVRLAMRRVQRTKARRPSQVRGLTSILLKEMVAKCPETVAGKRDAALLSLGYDTLCRSSELAAMRAEHLADSFSRIYVPRSKADPFGDGRVAYLSKPTARRVKAWLEASEITTGPLFRGLHLGAVSSLPLAASSIRRLIKSAAKRAELDHETVQSLSGHSMRVGAAQDMMLAGFETLSIMQAGGWKNQSVLARYAENAAAAQMHEERWRRLRELY